MARKRKSRGPDARRQAASPPPPPPAPAPSPKDIPANPYFMDGDVLYVRTLRGLIPIATWDRLPSKVAGKLTESSAAP